MRRRRGHQGGVVWYISGKYATLFLLLLLADTCTQISPEMSGKIAEGKRAVRSDTERDGLDA
eukprot:2040335-Prymnesium_polylepis.1